MTETTENLEPFQVNSSFRLPNTRSPGIPKGGETHRGYKAVGNSFVRTLIGGTTAEHRHLYRYGDVQHDLRTVHHFFKHEIEVYCADASGSETRIV